MSTILITGANGFIGRALGRVLKQAQFTTLGVARQTTQLPGYDTVYRGQLGQPLTGAFEEQKIDVLIHCANAAGPDEYELNVAGTKIWAEQAQDAGVSTQIFLSSISVLQQSPSSYARAKKDLEEWFVDHNGVVLRLGMVIGNGGIFARMQSLLKKFPLMPLLDGGAIPVYYSGIDSVCQIIEFLINEKKTKSGEIMNLQQQQPASMRSMLQEIKNHFGYHCVFIPLPSAPIYYALLILEKAGVRFLPVSSVNIKGARQNREMQLDSDYAKFGLPERDISELIKKLKQEKIETYERFEK